ncbi:MAG: hypothetical protein II178_00295, partial [Selenomonadaceae bacterium]|nr:hypothetical protein [Selenomonadaceae bacterium]
MALISQSEGVLCPLSINRHPPFRQHQRRASFGYRCRLPSKALRAARWSFLSTYLYYIMDSGSWQDSDKIFLFKFFGENSDILLSIPKDMFSHRIGFSTRSGFAVA